jgi:diaminopimelate decarboxylase
LPVAILAWVRASTSGFTRIATGKAENKFGIPLARARAVYTEAAALPGIEVVGVDVHIGSQLTELAPFEAAFDKVAELVPVLRADGHDIRRLDLGGGLGIPYRRANEAPPLPFDYGAVIRRTVGHLGCEIEIEPGRLIAGNAGVLLARVIYRKAGEGRDFLILDAAMNDLVRPAMYDAWHDIVPVVEAPPGIERAPIDVVGPVCETGDTFATARPLPPLAADDLVAFRSAGAYGAVMASEYNSRPLVPEVLVQGDHYAVVRARPSLAEMLARDTIPEWIGEPRDP